MIILGNRINDMKLYNDLKLRFEEPLWALNPELALFDVVLCQNPAFLKHFEAEVTKGLKNSNFGRKDSPTVEQIVRAAIYKEIKQLDYRELEIAMYDSNTFNLFLQLDGRKPFSFTCLQTYISKISKESITKLIVEINKLAYQENIETGESTSTDTTVVQTNVHYPTNNSLIWDCIKTATALLKKHRKQQKKQKDEDKNNHIQKLEQQKANAKKLNYQINNTQKEEQKSLFDPYLAILQKLIDDVKIEIAYSQKNSWLSKLESYIEVFEKVYTNAYRYQILGEKVENSKNIFSIYQTHTDIIVKGQREVEFGHKVLITRGKSNLILDFDVLKGNPSDKDLYKPAIEKVIENYTVIPQNSSCDGGFVTKENLSWAKERGLVNIVFTKITKTMKNIVESIEIELLLKKWRGGTEAVISNLKRGFGLDKINWEGWEKFQAKVAWSVLGYNLRVITNRLLK